jgi:alpha-L-arabinofuranosidase
MIWYNNLKSFRTCSYYVQQMYSLNKGSNVISLTMNGKPVAGNDDQDGLFASAVYDAATKSFIVKVVNTGDKAQPITLNFKGLTKGAHNCQTLSFNADKLDGENSIENPTAYTPKAGTASLNDNTFETTIAARTFVMYTVNK